MKHISQKNLWFIIALLALCAYYTGLRIHQIRWIHSPRSFGDTPEYFRVASQPLFSSAFWIAERAPVIPLFFKLLNKDPALIFRTQLWVSIIAWMLLALTVALVLKSSILKFIGFATVLGFSLTENIIIWDSLILSDSLALSLLALFLAACIWLIIDWKWYTVLVFAFLAHLLVFTRDSYAYLLLMAGLVVWALIFVTHQHRRVAIVGGILLLLFLISNAVATAGNRWYTPFLMTLGLRILPDPQYLSYFREHGMPVSDALMERAGKPVHADELIMLKDPRLEEFREWTKRNGREVYIKFLWEYKADALQKPLNDLELIFNPDVYYYAATGYRPIITNPRLRELLYPTRFGILAVLTANLLAAALILPAVQYRQLLWIVPMILILSSYPQAVLIWNADANDIARHSLYHNVELRLGLWLLILFAVDFVAKRMKLVVGQKKNES